jgi:hypothetical protein
MVVLVVVAKVEVLMHQVIMEQQVQQILAEVVVDLELLLI